MNGIYIEFDAIENEKWKKKKLISDRNLSATPDGRNVLNTKFKFCDNFTKPEDQDQFVGKYFGWFVHVQSCSIHLLILHTIAEYLTDVYGNLAMVNYPYESSFLAPLPANPVETFCGYLNESFEGLKLIDVSVCNSMLIFQNKNILNDLSVSARLYKKR